MRNAILFLAALLIVAFGFLVIRHRSASATLKSAPKSQLYVDTAYGYSFRYPADQAIQAYSPQYIAVGTSTANGGFASVAQADVALADASTSESFPDFAHEQAEIMCDADGPNGSISCPTIASSTPFTSAAGIAGEEFYLRQVSLDSSGATTTASVGPFFSFDISANVPQSQYAALIVHVPVPSQGGANAALIESIADSVQVARVSQ